MSYIELMRNSSRDPSLLNLTFNRAIINIKNRNPENYVIWGQFKDCYKCEPEALWSVEAKRNLTVMVFTQFLLLLQVFYDNDTKVCFFRQRFKENYVYDWDICNLCISPEIRSIGTNLYATLLAGLVVLGFLVINYYFFKCLIGFFRKIPAWRREILCNVIENREDGPPNNVVNRRHENTLYERIKRRSRSLDAFRGFVVLLMIFVNNKGGQFWFFQRSPWNGITYGDLVDPFFLWIMGFALIYSINDNIKKKIPLGAVILKILKRSMILYIFGVIVECCRYQVNDLNQIHFMGRPQRLAIVYLIMAMLELISCQNKSFIDTAQKSFDTCVIQEIIVAWKQWIFILSVLIIYSNLMYAYWPLGCPEKGYAGPGGHERDDLFENCTAGVSGYIDRMILGTRNIELYDKEIPKYWRLYQSLVAIENAGILSIFTACCVTHFGAHFGRIYLLYTATCQRLIRWIVNIIFNVILGLVLCGFSVNKGFIPLNHYLMSISFILVSSAWAGAIFVAFFGLLENENGWRGSLFNYPGINAGVIYVGHILTLDLFPFTFKPPEETHSFYLVTGLWTCLVWLCIAKFLWCKQVLITL